MLKLKLQYFGHLMWRADSFEKTLMLGGIGGRRKRGWQRMRWLDGITDLTDVSLSEPREMVVDREAWCAAIHGVAKGRTRLSHWTELNVPLYTYVPHRLYPFLGTLFLTLSFLLKFLKNIIFIMRPKIGCFWFCKVLPISHPFIGSEPIKYFIF